MVSNILDEVAQVELAQAKVEADRALKRSPDPLLVKIATAAGQQTSRRRLAR